MKFKNNEERFNKQKRLLFILGIVLAIATIASTYLLSDVSRIYHVAIIGSDNLKKEDVVKMSGLSLNDWYLFTSCNKVKEKVLANPLIKDCHVSKEEDRIIQIDIVEDSVVAYAYDDNDLCLYTSTFNKVKVDMGNMYLLEVGPYLSGFTSEQTEKLVYSLANIDQSVLSQISEIHSYPFSYDADMMEVIMQDGGYVFVSINDLDMLIDYYTIKPGVEIGECIYFDKYSDSRYVSACPWQEVEKIETLNEEVEE